MTEFSKESNIKHSKHKAKFRFYINHTSLIENKTITLTDSIFHHLHNVLRLKNNDMINVFNSYDGEFLGKIININKKEAQVKILSLVRKFSPTNYKIHLAYSPLKKNATDYTLSKSVEVGVTHITQIITENTVNNPLTVEKIEPKLILATQQCNRLDVPSINQTTKLLDFINANKNSIIFWLNEKKEGLTLSNYLQQNSEHDYSDVIFLIGPEGGFSADEIKLLHSYDFVIPVYMNTNILRAETAAIAALINFQIIIYNF